MAGNNTVKQTIGGNNNVIKGGYNVVTPNPPTPQPPSSNWGTAVPSSQPASSSSQSSAPKPAQKK